MARGSLTEAIAVATMTSVGLVGAVLGPFFADSGRLILKLFVSDRRRSHLWRYVGALRFGVRRLETLGPAN